MKLIETNPIKTLATLYANECKLESDYTYDPKSVEKGYIEGFITALRAMKISKQWLEKLKPHNNDKEGTN